MLGPILVSVIVQQTRLSLLGTVRANDQSPYNSDS